MEERATGRNTLRTIALCADDDCGLEIESINLLLCDAPGCNLTVCKCTYIFPLTSKLIIFYSQYHMTYRGELSKPQGGWFCDDECKKNAGFRVGKARKQTQGVLESNKVRPYQKYVDR